MEGSFPLEGMSSGVSIFLDQYNPMQGLVPLLNRLTRGNPIIPSENQIGGGYPPYN